MSRDNYFPGEGGITMADIEKATDAFWDAPPPTFGPRYTYFMTPAELRELKQDPERWARYQAYLRAHSGT